jgi:hypothetical protein
VSLDPGRTAHVSNAIEVLATIDFDDEAVLDRREIGDVRANRSLTPKLVARQSPIPQRHPQPMFGIGGVVP